MRPYYERENLTFKQWLCLCFDDNRHAGVEFLPVIREVFVSSFTVIYFQ